MSDTGTAAAVTDPALGREHGLTDAEFARIGEILGRAPSGTELGVFAAMWSEHCSYKSSKAWLKTLPTDGAQVICGPGENAGVVDLGDGLACVFKIESHNHPSFIEPEQGAATGVGGILRDVFTMGARPVAVLDALRFGTPEHPQTRHLLSGVAKGIGGYGNCVGIPNLGGETLFHESFNTNTLVNALTAGIARRDRLFYARAAGVGNPVLYVGAKTGRDGIHGATMASQSFDAEAAEKRPTVQVGDPFTEKLLLEACLELMAEDAIVAIQDMGAAGLTSSAVEMAAKGTLGIDLDLDTVPQREAGMNAYEMMLSESQERMLMVVRPDAIERARRVFAKWELDCAVVGRLTASGYLHVDHAGTREAAVPIQPLVERAPEYERPWRYPDSPAELPEAARDLPPGYGVGACLAELLGSPDLASKRWIWEQYDHMVGGDTVVPPGDDAGVVRIADPQGGRTGRGLALTTDCTSRYCAAGPVEGGKQAVAEAYRNLSAMGAAPLAITDNMNFGDPTKPQIMGQFVGCVQGMGAACAALDFPVVSGNVSLYNETDGRPVQPSPVVGGLGRVDEIGAVLPLALPQNGLTLLLAGGDGSHLGASQFARVLHNSEAGQPPPVDLLRERAAGEAVRALAGTGTVAACHDVGDGGLLVALAEMALAGGTGAELAVPAGYPPAAWLFGEDQGRYLLATAQPEACEDAFVARGVPVRRIGTTGGDSLTLPGLDDISLAELRARFEGWLPAYMRRPAGA